MLPVVMSRVTVRSVYGVVCGFMNCIRPLPFREIIGPSATKKITPKNEYFSVIPLIQFKLAVHLPRTNCNRHQLSGYTGKILPKLQQDMDTDFFFSKEVEHPLPTSVSKLLPTPIARWWLAHWTSWNDSLNTKIV